MSQPAVPHRSFSHVLRACGPLSGFLRLCGLAFSRVALAAVGFGCGLQVGHAQTPNESFEIGLSTDLIGITSDFNGARLVVFGALDNADAKLLRQQRYDIVVALVGPRRRVVVREKERTLGLWINRGSESFNSVPASYALASTRPLGDITREGLRVSLSMGIEDMRLNSGSTLQPSGIQAPPKQDGALPDAANPASPASTMPQAGNDTAGNGTAGRRTTGQPPAAAEPDADGTDDTSEPAASDGSSGEPGPSDADAASGDPVFNPASGPSSQTVPVPVGASDPASMARAPPLDEALGTKANRDRYATALRRIREGSGLYNQSFGSVEFVSPTLFRADLRLPADLPVGQHMVRAYLFRSGVFIRQQSEPLVVVKTGFESVVDDFATRYGFLYGLFAVALAIFTGWFGRIVFKRD